MLKTAQKMLDDPKKTSRVKCAKEILDAVIEHLEKQSAGPFTSIAPIPGVPFPFIPETTATSKIHLTSEEKPTENLSPEGEAAKNELTEG